MFYQTYKMNIFLDLEKKLHYKIFYSNRYSFYVNVAENHRKLCLVYILSQGDTKPIKNSSSSYLIVLIFEILYKNNCFY